MPFISDTFLNYKGGLVYSKLNDKIKIITSFYESTE